MKKTWAPLIALIIPLAGCTVSFGGSGETTTTSTTTPVTTTSLTATPSTVVPDDDVNELAARLAWDQASPSDQQGMCLLYGVDPDRAEAAFTDGAGGDAEARQLWGVVEQIMKEEC